MTTAAAVVIGLRAIHLLETHGWCQGDFRNVRGEYCIRGATARATFDLFGQDHTPEREQLHQAIAALAGYNGAAALVGWNDEKGRTKQEVLDVLHAAVNQLEGTTVKDVNTLVSNLLAAKDNKAKAYAAFVEASKANKNTAEAVERAGAALADALAELKLLDDIVE